MNGRTTAPGPNAGPIFGADYYPEQWPEEFWESDAERMAEAGISAVRLMEFAWAVLEPSQGNYDFRLFDRVLDIFARRGFQIVLGTPTATVPSWMADNDIFQVHPVHGPRNFGTRRQACLNAPEYLSACESIVRACAQHFSGAPGVVGWQVDNELGHEGSDLCVCAHCRGAWHLWLETRYGSLAELNRVWGSVFWSTTYTDWSQIPQPGPQVMSIHNPGLILDYYRFLSDSNVRFLESQVGILRSLGPAAWEITTDSFIPPNGHCIDLRRLFDGLDEVGVNNYPVWGGQAEPIAPEMHSLAIQLFRGLKPREDFTVFEQICGFQGHRELGYLPPPEQIVHWTNHVIAHGARRVFYFRWRTARTGQEQLCHGLVDPGRDDTPHFRALRQAWRDRRTDYAKILRSKRSVQALLLWSKDESHIVKDQWLSTGFPYDAGFIDAGYDVELAHAAAPLVVFNAGFDVRETAAVSAWPIDLSAYKLVVLPLKQLGDPRLEAALDQWVRDGGTLVLGYRSGTRTAENHAVDLPLPGPWAEMAGVRIASFEALGHGSTDLSLRGSALARLVSGAGRLFRQARPQGRVWADYLEPAAGTRVLARYRQGWNRGMAAATLHPWGRGRVVYLGTRLNPAAVFALWPAILRSAGIRPEFLGQGVEMVRRDLPAKLPESSPGAKDTRRADQASGKDRINIILNHSGKTRRTRYGILKPYQMRLVEERLHKE